MDKKYYNIKKAAEIIGVSDDTLRRWEHEGKIKPQRTQGGHRRFTLDELNQVRNLDFKKKITIAYCRVSTAGQKEDLARQKSVLEQYCVANGYCFRTIEDFGSGLNYNRNGFKELIYLIQTHKVDRVVVNYKDRLTRFGFEMFEQMCEFHHVDIDIINHTEEKTYEQELVDDILAIITVFSSRLYGRRSHKQKKILDESKNLFRDKL